MGFIDFTNGEVLTADQMDTVMRQGIMRFADASARDTALSAVLAEGMMAYLDDTDEVLKYDGSQWIDISGDISGVTAGTALTGGGTSGNVTLDVDEAALTIAQSQVTDLTTDLAGKQDDVITTQGDLVIGDASGDPVRLPVGAADQVLTSDGTTVSFQNAGGGGAKVWTEIVSTTTVTAVNSVSITGLSGFDELKIVLTEIEQGDRLKTLFMRINGDSSSLYTQKGLALGTTSGSTRRFNSVDDDKFTLAESDDSFGSEEIITGIIALTGATQVTPKWLELNLGAQGGSENDQVINAGGYYEGSSTVSSVEIGLSSSTTDFTFEVWGA